MAAEQVHRYAEADGVQLLESRYKGDRFNMVLILPKERDGLAAVERRLSDAKLGEWLTKLDAAKPQEVGVLLPKVQVSSSYALVDPLKSLGMTTAFDRRRAEFGGISNRPIYISDVVQKTFLRIDEKGTEAAAASGVVMRQERSGPELQFRADHPFLALIRDSETGAMLFFGRISEP